MIERLPLGGDCFWRSPSCGILVAGCFFYIDVPVACFVRRHYILSDANLNWLVQIAGWLNKAIMAGTLGVLLWRLVWRGGERQKLLVAIAVSLLVTEASKDLLKWTFGRPVPRVWFDAHSGSVESLCGFRPFASPAANQSFPSGHAAITVAVVSVLWRARPRWRWLYALIGGAICVALIALNCHFVSDVLSGAMLGSLAGLMAVRVFRMCPARLRHPPE